MNFQPPDPPDFGNCPTCGTGIERDQLRGDKCTECEFDVVQKPLKLKDLEFSTDASGNITATRVVTKCGLGEHCRCAKGDEPGCWNWPE